jgi:hypothetical protein
MADGLSEGFILEGELIFEGAGSVTSDWIGWVADIFAMLEGGLGRSLRICTMSCPGWPVGEAGRTT